MSKWLQAAAKASAPSAKAKLILICLADFADENGRAWPSQKTLEAASHLSERSVRRALIELERAGLVRREKRYRNGGRGGRTSDVFLLTLPAKSAGKGYRSEWPVSGEKWQVTGQFGRGYRSEWPGNITLTGYLNYPENYPEREGARERTPAPPLDEASARPDDRERKAPSEPSQRKSRSRSASKRGSRFADSRWGGVVPDDWLAWAEERGLPAVAAKDEAEKFADYWAGVPGQKGVKLDWEATWRNWVRRALESRGASADERSKRRQDEAVSPSSDFDVPDDLDAIEAQLREAAGVQASISPALFDLSPIIALLRDGFSLEYDILPKARELRRRGKDFYSWRYLERIVRSEATATTGASAPRRPADRWPEAARFSADDWSARLAMARSKRVWDYVSWGPPPGHPGCLVPSELLRSDDGIGWMIRTGEAA